MSIALIAMLLIQCGTAAFAADVYPEVLHLEGGVPDENGVWIPAYIADSDGNPVEQTDGLVRAAASLPSKYDLRTYGVVTPVKNQAGSGNCWAFSSIASLESNYIFKGYGTAANTDFSEAHLAWFSQRERTPDRSDPTYGDGLECAKPFTTGGNWQRAASTLMRGSGVQLEQNAPWIETWDESVLMRMQQPESARYVSYARTWSVTGIRSASRDELKRKIMENGAAVLAYYDDYDVYKYDPSLSGYSTDRSSYYQNSVADGVNHYVSVIGWDDNYARTKFNVKHRPRSNGAWLIKGSWGTGFGSNVGYYWISYEEPTIDEFASYTVAPADIYDHIYQYDGAFPTIFFKSQNPGKIANVFTSSRNELLTHVAFFSPNTALVRATAEIYMTEDGYSYFGMHPTMGLEKQTAATTTVSDVEYGYTTIELASPVPLKKGSVFTVVVTLERMYPTADDPNVLLPAEGETKNNPGDGELTYSGSVGDSYICFGGNTWYDTNAYPNNVDYNNVPVKAMTHAITLRDPAITVETAPGKTTYLYGETLNTAGLTLRYTDEFGLEEIVTDGFVCSPTTFSSIGTQNIRVTYNGLQTTFPVTVEPHETALTLQSAPSKTTYRCGDQLRTDGLSLLYTDEYGATHTVTSGYSVSPNTLSVIGTQVVTVTYGGRSVTFNVTVEPHETMLKLLSEPAKTTYSATETLDTSGLSLLYTDEYNQLHIVTEGFTCTPETFRVLGTQTVTVTYGAKSVTFDVTVEPLEKTLTVRSSPAKTTYLYGDTLDTTGLSLLYTDEIGDAYVITEGFTCAPLTLDTLGQQTVTATYGGLSASFDVTVNPYAPTLSLQTSPFRTTYHVGDTLDTTGLSLVYTDELHASHVVTDGFSVTPHTLTQIGAQTVTVTYNDLSVTFYVMAEPYTPTLTLLSEPDKTTYKVHETLDTQGLSVLYTDEYNVPHTVTQGLVCSPHTLRTIGTQTVTVTYGVPSVTFDVTVEPLEPTLTLQTPPSKTTYFFGDTLDTAGMTLVYTDEYGDALAVTEGFVCNVQTLSSFGTQTVTATYNGLSVTFSVTVNPYEPTLTLVSAPTKTAYLWGEQLDTTGLSLRFRNEYGDVRTVTKGYTCDFGTFEQFGTQTVTVTYHGLSVTFDVTVEPHVPTLTIEKLPQKQTYFASERVDTTGLTLVYTDEYGTASSVTGGFTRMPETVRALGTQTVTVTYNGLSVTYDVTVEPLEPTLTVQSPPEKTAYLIGELLDTQGLTLVYTDEYGDALVVSEGFVCAPGYFTEVGTRSVTVTYNGLQTSFDVTVDLHEPKLTILSMPDKTRYFEGDTLDLTGLTLVYSDEYGSVSEITDGFTYESITFSGLGYRTVTVSCRGLSVSFDVKVVLMDPTLEITAFPEKTEYLYGETLDTKGLTLLYTDDFGEQTTVTEGYTCTAGTLSALGTQTVGVSYLGLTVTFEVTVDPLEPTLTIRNLPETTTYMVGDAFDPTGLTLVYTDEYGDALVVTDGFACTPETFAQYGLLPVTVTYKDISASFNVTVNPYEPKLTLLTPPEKTTYMVGDVLETEGLTMVFTDEYNTDHPVTYGFVYEPHTLDTIGTQTVSVTYSDFTVTFDVTVEPYVPTLTVLRAPEKKNYTVGDTLDPTGILLQYSDEYGRTHSVTDGCMFSPQTLRTIGTQTVTVTYNASSASFDVTVEPFETTLTLLSAPAKTAYLYGDTLDPTGLSLLYSDEYGDAVVVTEGFVCDAETFTSLGTQTVTVTYLDRSVTFDVTVAPHEPTLSVQTLPGKTTYLVGDRIDTAGLVLLYTDAYKAEFTVTEGYSVQPQTLREIGAQTVTVTYQEKTVSFTVTVEPYEKTLSVVHAPDKTTYLVGDPLETAGLELLYTDEYGQAHTVTDDYVCTPHLLRTIGTQTVTVSYGTKSAAFEVTVEPYTPTLTLLSAPLKTTYLYGEAPQTAGLSLRYTDEYNEASVVTDGFVCTPQTLDAFGTQTVTVTHNGLSVSFDVTVEPHEPTLTLLSAPDKTTYLYGESPDPAGLTLLYTDEFGKAHTVTEGFRFAPQTLDELGTQTVTVTYRELTVSFNVTVEPHQPTLSLLTPPDKTTCLAAHTIDTTGLSLVYTDEYGQAQTVTEGYTCTPEIPRALGTQTVTVTYKGLSATFRVTVEPLAPTLTMQFEPSKTEYKTGDAPDTSGLTLLYTDEVGDAQIVTEGFVCTPAVFHTPGEQTVTVAYKDVTVTFNVTVELSDAKLTLKSAPRKTAYFVGETVDPAGLTLEYTDPYAVTHTISEGITLSPAKLQSAGTQTVRASYEGLSVTFSVTVKAVEPVSLRVVSGPSNGAYTYRRSPDFSGLTVSVLYNDGHEETVNDLSQMTIQPESDARVRRGSRTFRVTTQGISATFTMQVQLAVWQWLILIFLLGFIWY